MCVRVRLRVRVRVCECVRASERASERARAWMLVSIPLYLEYCLDVFIDTQ